MSSYGVPEPSDEQEQLLENAIDAIDHLQRPWWRRVMDRVQQLCKRRLRR